ncbi:hypothetical protein EYZ11_012828 [Aspergillus tanneri]|uniref:Uncharacterized protein n=1 Tax=Aspergillus tanneri TaxID=1220188 RepID=A0A4V3UMK8_9EURO|nr:hypothetical protein EYZ11_012828 [Aspergillus tanneri]
MAGSSGGASEQAFTSQYVSSTVTLSVSSDGDLVDDRGSFAVAEEMLFGSTIYRTG